MIHNKGRISRFVTFLFFLPVCALIACTQTPTPLKSIDAPQGGKIIYGLVEGAKTEAAAMGTVLRAVHNDCGEKPQVGKVFKVRGTNSNAVYFTVVNRPGGNKRVAGLLIATQSSPGRVEAALVSDEASRFASTVNPMLQQLFGVWHPGGTEAASAPAPSERSASGGRSSAPAAPLRKVTLPDQTASVGIPDGWNVDPTSGGGSMLITGPQGERIFLNHYFLALDPTGSAFKRMQGTRIKPLPHTVIYPYKADMAKGFPKIFQLLRASNGLPPAEIQIDRVEQVPESQGMRCVKASGRVNPDGKGMRAMDQIIYATAPDRYGGYAFRVFGSFLPDGATERDRATALAVIGSFQQNEELIKRNVDVEVAPILASMKRKHDAQQQQLLARSQRIVNQIKQTGAEATARYNATQARNDAQHQAWNNQQNSNSRNAQGFSNYLLDQTVVQDNYHNTRSTEWNRTADTLVKANPNRFEAVDTPNYWKGVDY